MNINDVGERAALRVWAAEVRDRGGKGAGGARLLCRMIDLWEGRRPGGLKDLLADNIDKLARLVKEEE